MNRIEAYRVGRENRKARIMARHKALEEEAKASKKSKSKPKSKLEE